MSRLNELSREVIGAAIEVHRTLGPGFLESVYESALVFELQTRGIPVQRQGVVEIGYKGQAVGESRLDLLVDRVLVVELKAVESLTPLHEAQVLSYLKALDLHLGLLMNFNSTNLARTIRRLVYGAPPEVDPGA
ncbi:MAG: GxxExxY protein [Dehalococcoidia bacterium]|jgi:GxxExxY protein